MNEINNIFHYYSGENAYEKYEERLQSGEFRRNQDIAFVESQGAIYTHGHKFGGLDAGTLTNIYNSLWELSQPILNVSPSSTNIGDTATFTISSGINGYKFPTHAKIIRTIPGTDTQPKEWIVEEGSTINTTDTITIPANATSIKYELIIYKGTEGTEVFKTETKTVKINIDSYIYYGSGTTSADATNRVAMKTATEFNLTVTHAGDYLLICVPSNKTVSKIEVGGFDTTSNYTKTDATIDNKPYSFYKSNTQSDAVTYNVKITINNQ